MANLTLDDRENNYAVIYEYDNDRFDKSEKCCLEIKISINMYCYLRGETVGVTHCLCSGIRKTFFIPSRCP